jgi:membrane associated rhomboid family serine protease
MSVTLIIIIITSIVSIVAFGNKELFEKLKFNPSRIIYKKEYYRILTHAFLHANFLHLLINMLVLFSFGIMVEYYFVEFLGVNKGKFLYLILYLTSIIFSVLFSLQKHKDDVFYNAVGASGAVSAIVFTSIFFEPWDMVYFFGIIPIPAIIFGVIYLYYSYIMSKKDETSFIAHDVHFWGSVYGFIFPVLINYKFLFYFIYKLFFLK